MNHNKINNEVLNDLIQINNDRIEGYKKAMDQLKIEDEDLKMMFAELARESSRNKNELIEEIQVSGETPKSGTTTSGKLYRFWMDVSNVFTDSERDSILDNCERGEDAARDTYHAAINMDGISSPIRTIIENQLINLQESNNRLKAMRRF